MVKRELLVMVAQGGQEKLAAMMRELGGSVGAATPRQPGPEAKAKARAYSREYTLQAANVANTTNPVRLMVFMFLLL